MCSTSTELLSRVSSHRKTIHCRHTCLCPCSSISSLCCAATTSVHGLLRLVGHWVILSHDEGSGYLCVPRSAAPASRLVTRMAPALLQQRCKASQK